MAEETKAEAQTVEVTPQSIAPTDQEGKKLEIPEGKVLTGMRVYCDRHGDITQSSRLLQHIIHKPADPKDPNSKPVAEKYMDVICLACMSDLLKAARDAGKIGQISVAPVFEDKEEVEKKLAEIKKEEEAKKAAEGEKDEKVQD